MADVSELQLPGVGVRYEFVSHTGARIAVVAHRSGRCEIYRGDTDDPDAFQELLELNEDESRTLAELLGGSRVTRELSRLRQSVQGLSIDWIPLDPDSPYAHGTIGDTGTRTRTGVSIVAVLRGDEAIPAPGPDLGLMAGDTLVVVGEPRGIEALVAILHDG